MKIKYINILVVGPQHSGKSCFINTVYRYLTGGMELICDIGRTVDAGTIFYEKKTVLADRLQKGKERFYFFDTAGRYFSDGFKRADRNQLKKLQKGLKCLNTNLVTSEWENIETTKMNEIDMVIFVINRELYNNLDPKEKEAYKLYIHTMKELLPLQMARINPMVITTHSETPEVFEIGRDFYEIFAQIEAVTEDTVDDDIQEETKKQLALIVKGIRSVMMSKYRNRKRK